MNYKQLAVDGIRWSSMTSMLSFSIGLIQIAIIARYLSPDEIGIISLVTVIIGTGRVFGDAGMSNAIIHFQDLNAQQINALYWINVIVAFFISSAIFFLALPIANLLSTADLAPFIRIMSFAIVLGSIGQQFYILLKRDFHFKEISLIDLAQRVVIFMSIIIMLVVWKMGILSVIYATVIGSIVYSTVSIMIGLKYFNLPNLIAVNFSNLKECLRFGGFQFMDRSVGYLSSNLDKLFIGRFFGTDVLGIYELATVLINRPISIINPMFNNVSFPLFSKMQHDLPRLNQWYIKKIAIISMISAAIYCGMYSIRYELVEFIYGEDWNMIASSLSVLFILGYFKSVSNPMGTYVLALGRPDISLYFKLYQICIHISLLVIGVLFYDYMTAITIYVAGAIIFTIPPEYYMRYYLSKMPVSPLFFKIIKHFFLAMIMVILIYFSRHLFTQYNLNNTVYMLILISLGVLFYGLINLILNQKLLKELLSLIRR